MCYEEKKTKEYDMKRIVTRNRIIGYSLAALLYIVAEILIFFVNKGNYYYLDLFALTVMCIPMVFLKWISYFLIYFTYSKNKYYIDIYDDHIEGIGRLKGRTTYLYIRFFAMEEMHCKEKSNAIFIYTYDDNEYELLLKGCHYHMVLQKLFEKFRTINCRDLYKFYTDRY